MIVGDFCLKQTPHSEIDFWLSNKRSLLCFYSTWTERVCTRGSLSTRIFETRTGTGSELISLLTCPHTTTFTLLSFFFPLEISSINVCETRLPAAVRVSKTRVLLKLPNVIPTTARHRAIATRWSSPRSTRYYPWRVENSLLLWYYLGLFIVCLAAVTTQITAAKQLTFVINSSKERVESFISGLLELQF